MIKLFALILFVTAMGKSYQVFSAILAFAIAITSMLLSHFLCKNQRYDKVGLKINYNFLVYLIYLLKEIFFSTIAVCKAIFFIKKADINPLITTIPIKQNTDEAQVLLGNSITLTPGTITIDITKKKIMLHAIDAKCIDGCKDLDLQVTKSQT